MLNGRGPYSLLESGSGNGLPLYVLLSIWLVTTIVPPPLPAKYDFRTQREQ